MKLSEIMEQNFFNYSESVHAEIYYINKSGIPYHDFNARIIPFIPETKNANNVILFHHIDSDIISSGQISGFNLEQGIYLYLFSMDEHNNVIINKEV